MECFREVIVIYNSRNYIGLIASTLRTVLQLQSTIVEII